MSRLMDRPARRLAAAAGVAIAAAALVSAQAAPPQSPPSRPPAQGQPPTFRSEANYVRVDVYPSVNGTPVTDLTIADFEVLEDGVLQKLEAFEHVTIAPAGPQALRAEPNTIEASRQLAANPRNRVFVLFLDVPHVSVDGAWHVREPLIRLVDRILGPEDLVGVMTPGMAASDVVLARKTEVLTGGLRDRWPWGERHTLARTEREKMYVACYPWPELDPVVNEMIARRRERTTLDAINELVTYLGGLRDDRKAILTVTEGWLLYRPDRDLTRPRVITDSGSMEPIPGPPPIYVNPGGKLGMIDRNDGAPLGLNDCNEDRVRFAEMDNERYFRDIIERANRWNASFYTVDPRGLAVFDAPIGPEKPPPVSVDYRNLRTRHESMQVLAANTDGMSAINSNNLEPAFKRIADDLTSYYLLGYYSTNAKTDGRFRALKVRVKRPGVEVRARRGYLAATTEEVTAARRSSAAPVPEPLSAVHAALTSLASLQSDRPLRVNVVPQPATDGVRTVWVAGELRLPSQGAAAGVVDIQITGGGTGAATIPIAAGQRSFLAPIALAAPATGGTLDVRVRLSGYSTVPHTDQVRVDVHGAPRALFYRRGPVSGNRVVPAGAPQFSRTERARFDIPVDGSASNPTGRLLDRNAQPLAVPVTLDERLDEGSGQRWITAEITLAPLTMGDYALEIGVTTGSTAQRVLTAFRLAR